MQLTLKNAYHRLLAPAAAMLWLTAASVAGAQGQGTCFVNGKEVPCEEALAQFKSTRNAENVVSKKKKTESGV